MPQTIVHLTRRYAPHIGGVETHVAALNELLIKQNWHVVVLTEQHAPQLPTTELINKVKVIRMPQLLSTKWQVWQWLWSQRQVLDQADIIQVHDVFWWLLPYVFTRFFTRSSRIFTTFHGWEGEWPVRWQAKLQRWLWAQLSAGTVHVGGWIQEFYWDRPSTIIYGGVKALKTQPSASSKLPKPATLKLVFLGRLVAENEVTQYLEFVKQLKKQFPKVSVNWVGDGPYRGECEKLGTVTGIVDNPESYITKADVVMAASYLSILQAQRLGKVVLAFYSHRLKQRYLQTYPGRSAMIISNSPLLAVDHVLTLLTTPILYQEAITAARAVADQYTWLNVLAHYQKLWQKK
ncbi:MAG TPA: glycosyltransferase family 4 protein [Vitreimonas sp.]|nr:glycosyltransferase family 4 protein [Vitreimonas sp.]